MSKINRERFNHSEVSKVNEKVDYRPRKQKSVKGENGQRIDFRQREIKSKKNPYQSTLQKA